MTAIERAEVALEVANRHCANLQDYYDAAPRSNYPTQERYSRWLVDARKTRDALAALVEEAKGLQAEAAGRELMDAEADGFMSGKVVVDKSEYDALVEEAKALGELQDACIKRYCGMTGPDDWREAVRKSPEGQLLIALAAMQSEQG